MSDKISAGLNQAIASAKCDHAFVMVPKQPRDTRYIRVFCPRCEATFLAPKDNPDKLLPIHGQRPEPSAERR